MKAKRTTFASYASSLTMRRQSSVSIHMRSQKDHITKFECMYIIHMSYIQFIRVLCLSGREKIVDHQPLRATSQYKAHVPCNNGLSHICFVIVSIHMRQLCETKKNKFCFICILYDNATSIFSVNSYAFSKKYITNLYAYATSI